ncbi:hypothetical protein C8R45DRAFT_1163451 [Mycena sanguinolenta]|nr:hypothetical protein C8R45DRAFT_1163451 [Mycena sanguinolenta]
MASCSGFAVSTPQPWLAVVDFVLRLAYLDELDVGMVGPVWLIGQGEGIQRDLETESKREGPRRFSQPSTTGTNAAFPPFITVHASSTNSQPSTPSFASSFANGPGLAYRGCLHEDAAPGRRGLVLRLTSRSFRCWAENAEEMQTPGSREEWDVEVEMKGREVDGGEDACSSEYERQCERVSEGPLIMIQVPFGAQCTYEITTLAFSIGAQSLFGYIVALSTPLQPWLIVADFVLRLSYLEALNAKVSELKRFEGYRGEKIRCGGSGGDAHSCHVQAERVLDRSHGASL